MRTANMLPDGERPGKPPGRGLPVGSVPGRSTGRNVQDGASQQDHSAGESSRRN